MLPATALLLIAAILLAGCQQEAGSPTPEPPAAPDAPPTWPASPYVLSGCSGFYLGAQADGAAIAERLPNGFARDGNRFILQAMFCESAAAGDAEPISAHFVLAIVPVVARAGEGPEFFVVEASSSDPVARAGFEAVGIPGDLVEVHAPAAPGGSWEVRGDATHYTVTIAPNAAGRNPFADATYRIWAGPEGGFTGFLELGDRDDHDRLPTACSLLIAEGVLQGLPASAACTVQLSYGDSTTLRQEPVTA